MKIQLEPRGGRKGRLIFAIYEIEWFFIGDKQVLSLCLNSVEADSVEIALAGE